jgi:photosystem II stability/assembly factor-like uncharacterized protein
MKCRLSFIILGAAVCAWLAFLHPAFGQGTAFTYQGLLTTNGTAPTGNFDMQFKLHPASSGTNQVGPTLTSAPVVVSNGLFLVTLDFTITPYNGSPLWLEVGVRTNGSSNAYTILSPTQPITSTPYSVMSLNAGTAAALTGNITTSQLPTNVPLLGGTNVFTGPVTFSNGMGKFSGTLSGTFNGSGSLSGTFSGTSTGTFNGNGGGLTNLNVTNLVGVVQSNPSWQLVQGTSQQAVSANSYLETNSALTTLILPPSPAVGDTFRFSGSGVGGWMLAQNAGQSILTTGLGSPAGKNWSLQSNSPSVFWRTLASSANGLNLVGAVYNGDVYTSSNAGQTWTARTASNPWYSVASSSDGTRLAAAINGGQIAISMNSGTNWTNYGPSKFWSSVTASANGTKFAAAVNGEYIYTSVNSGVTWTQQATSLSTQPWYSIASSADGTKLVAVVNNGSIYTSIDSGVTWSNRNLTKPWYSVASSSDGTELVAVANNDYIYTSGDSGANWTQRATSLSTQPWVTVSSSGDGTCLVAVVNNGLIYSSTDSGQTWTARTSGNQPWYGVCVSTDGTRAAAAINGGQIYTSTSATTVGTGGYLMGSQYSNIELQYIGNGQWMPLTFAGTFTAN